MGKRKRGRRAGRKHRRRHRNRQKRQRASAEGACEDNRASLLAAQKADLQAHEGRAFNRALAQHISIQITQVEAVTVYSGLRTTDVEGGAEVINLIDDEAEVINLLDDEAEDRGHRQQHTGR